MTFSTIIRLGLIASLALLSACSGSKDVVPADAPGFVNGKPVHPTIKIGKPYRVKGQTYYPKYQPHYEERGLASWYGPGFHGKSTANGEQFNEYAMTAAHKTLPLPSMVKVTNLKTGKEIMVRINDRGPFVDGRIIDLSRAAAQELGVIGSGVAEVKVSYLKAETEQYIAKLQLKKPPEMLEDGFQIASTYDPNPAAPTSGKPVDLSNSAPSFQSVPLDPIIVESKEEKPVSLVRKADDLPEDVAPTTTKPVTTAEARGVKIEEVGYLEDAFSVLTKPAYALAPAGGNSLTDSRATDPPVPRRVSSGSNDIHVQLGSFSSELNARNLVQKVGHISPTQMIGRDTEKGRIWRVVMGPMFNEGIAEEVVHRVRDYGINDARIIRETFED